MLTNLLEQFSLSDPFERPRPWETTDIIIGIDYQQMVLQKLDPVRQVGYVGPAQRKRIARRSMHGTGQ